VVLIFFVNRICFQSASPFRTTDRCVTSSPQQHFRWFYVCSKWSFDGWVTQIFIIATAAWWFYRLLTSFSLFWWWFIAFQGDGPLVQ